jgi:hypothetical protein
MAPANDGRHRLGHVHPYVAAYQIIGQEPYDNFVVHVSNHFTINPDRTITAMAYHFRVSCGFPSSPHGHASERRGTGRLPKHPHTPVGDLDGQRVRQAPPPPPRATVWTIAEAG